MDLGFDRIGGPLEDRSGATIVTVDGANGISVDTFKYPDAEADLVARDAGIDGGAATAEEAAIHVVDDDDTDIRSE